MLGWLRRSLVSGVLLALVPLAATALTMNPNPQSFNNGTDIGTITLVATVTGTPVGAAAVPLVGTIGAGDITLIFQVTVTGGYVESLGVGVFDTSPFGGVNSTGAGWISGANADITSITGTAGTRIFDFDGDGNLNAGQTSDYFFISYASLETDGTQKVNFMVNGSTGSDIPLSSTIEVPEPALLSLLGVGLVALALVRGRRVH